MSIDSGFDAGDPDNGGRRRAGIVSPKGGVVIGPFNGTEVYINGGLHAKALAHFRCGHRLVEGTLHRLRSGGRRRPRATSVVNLAGGYKLSRNLKVLVDVFNLFDAADSDIDYYYPSRLPGEPLAGINDIHLHPTLPRTARVSLVVGF